MTVYMIMVLHSSVRFSTLHIQNCLFSPLDQRSKWTFISETI